MRYVFSVSLVASLVLLGDVWVQTDWEGGAGQTVYSDTTMFQTGNLEYLLHPGQLWLYTPNDTVWMKPVSRFEPRSNLTTSIIWVNDTVFAATALNGYVHYSSNYVAWHSMDTLPTAYDNGNLITTITYGKDSSIYIGGVINCFTSSVRTIVWRSDDHRTWVNPDSLDITHILPAGQSENIKYIFALIEVDDSTLLAGTDGGNGSSADHKGIVFRSFNRGVTWDTLGIYGIFISKFIQGKGDTIWMLTGDAGVVHSSGGVWYTTDKGTNWTYQDSVPEILLFSAAKKDTVCLGGTGVNGGIYLSYDNGKAWTESPGDTVIPDTAVVSDIFVAKDGSIYATTYNDGKIYKSIDDGITWDSLYDLRAESGNRTIMGIIQTKEGHLVAAIGDNFGGNDSAGVLLSGYSTDGDIISSVFHSPFDTTSYGILHYKKGGVGVVQVKVRTGSDSLMSDAMDWDSCDVAQDGDSLLNLNSVSKQDYIQYRILFHSPSTVLSPYFDSIAIEYNNDAGINEATKQSKNSTEFRIAGNLIVKDNINLLFSTDKESDVEISIYNVAGERIGTLLKTHLDKGVYHKTYSLKGLSSGIYFVSFKTGERIENKKIVVIR